jgi:hypothetical protein
MDPVAPASLAAATVLVDEIRAMPLVSSYATGMWSLIRALRRRPAVPPLPIDHAAVKLLAQAVNDHELPEYLLLGKEWEKAWGNVPAGSRLPSEATRLWRTSGIELISDLREPSAVLRRKIWHVVPQLEHPDHQSPYHEMLSAVADTTFAVATRALLPDSEYQQITRPWRTVFGSVPGETPTRPR